MVVPLTMPSTRVIRSPTSDSRSGPDERDAAGDRRLEEQVDAGGVGRLEQLGAVVGQQLLVAGDHRLLGCQRGEDQRAGRLDAADHLDDRRRCAGSSTTAAASVVSRPAGRSTARSLRGAAHGDGGDLEAHAGAGGDLVGLLGDQPGEGRADVAAPEQARPEPSPSWAGEGSPPPGSPPRTNPPARSKTPPRCRWTSVVPLSHVPARAFLLFGGIAVALLGVVGEPVRGWLFVAILAVTAAASVYAARLAVAERFGWRPDGARRRRPPAPPPGLRPVVPRRPRVGPPPREPRHHRRAVRRRVRVLPVGDGAADPPAGRRGPPGPDPRHVGDQHRARRPDLDLRDRTCPARRGPGRLGQGRGGLVPGPRPAAARRPGAPPGAATGPHHRRVGAGRLDRQPAGGRPALHEHRGCTRPSPSSPAPPSTQGRSCCSGPRCLHPELERDRRPRAGGDRRPRPGADPRRRPRCWPPPPSSASASATAAATWPSSPSSPPCSSASCSSASPPSSSTSASATACRPSSPRWSSRCASAACWPSGSPASSGRSPHGRRCRRCSTRSPWAPPTCSATRWSACAWSIRPIRRRW